MDLESNSKRQLSKRTQISSIAMHKRLKKAIEENVDAPVARYQSGEGSRGSQTAVPSQIHIDHVEPCPSSFESDHSVESSRRTMRTGRTTRSRSKLAEKTDSPVDSENALNRPLGKKSNPKSRATKA